jgi:hypothetical protein
MPQEYNGRGNNECLDSLFGVAPFENSVDKSFSYAPTIDYILAEVRNLSHTSVRESRPSFVADLTRRNEDYEIERSLASYAI